MRKRGNAICDILRFLVILGLSSTSSSSSSSGSHRLVSREDKVSRKDQNVGSVLFDRGDSNKVCWGNEELILLASRSIFQDIMPQASMIDCRNDSYISLLMEYIDVCLEAVRQLTKGKTKHLVLKALADTIAGYLRVYILPITKKSFYAGNIPYQKAKKIFDLYDELKVFLRSSGDGWKRPTLLFHPKLDVAPINIPTGKSENDCAGLVLYPGFDGSVSIPIPFLDDPHNPNSIALPFESENLWSLFSEKSAFILIKYYTACAKCLESRSSKMELEKFRKQFYDWIHKSVIRHLDEEKWYPAFGGIMRVVVSLERTGLSSGQKPEGGYEVLPEVFKGRDKSGGYGPGVHHTAKSEGDGFGRNEVVVIVAACALLIWLLLGMILVCYRFLATRSHDPPKDTPTAVLYENTKYPSPGNSSPSEGGIFKRLTDRWRRKYPRCRCPDDDEEDDDEEDEERCLGSMSYTSEDSERRMANEKKKKRTKFTSIPSHNLKDCRSFRKNYDSSDFS